METRKMIIPQTRTDRPALKYLYTHVRGKIANDWYDIGVALLDPGDEVELDIIDTNYSTDIDKCAARMLKLWLERKPEASWNQLLEALREPNIKLNALAAQIEEMLSEGITDDRSSESIEATFAAFVDEMLEVLEKQNFDQIKRKCLENVNIIGGVKLSKDNEKEIADTKNVGELFTVMCCRLRPYWNWMNIRILEKMAGNCMPAKQLIEKYKKDVCSRKVKDVISEISNLENPTDYTEVKEKFNKNFNDLVIGEIVTRWNEIEKKLRVEETMLLKSITAGCVEICWLLRNDLVDHAIHSATSSHPFSQSATQELIDDDHWSVTREPAKDNGHLATQELFAEVLYLKIGDVVIKDDTMDIIGDAKGLPAPNNVRATAISHSSVEVTWDQLSDATEYIISYYATASHISGGSVTVEGTSSTLSGLVQNTPYAITVQAMTGDSRRNALSSEVSVLTHAAVPSSPPHNIVIARTDPASLKVSWQPPLESHNVPITGYVIQYIKDGSQDMFNDIENIKGTTHTISGLDLCTKYVVKVAAMNVDRTGPFSEPVVEFSAEDGDPTSAQQGASDDRKRQNEDDTTSRKIKRKHDTSGYSNSAQQGASGDRKRKQEDGAEDDAISRKRKCMDDTKSDAGVITLPPSKGEKFTTLLKKMNLHEEFPQKLSFKEAVTIRQETLGIIHTTNKLPILPYLILQKIMMCDQRCRFPLFKLPSSTTKSQPVDSDSELSDSDSDDEDDADDERLHPVDCMLAVLHCCDDILRQELFFKLSLCQLALPFLLPNPTDNSVTFLLWAMRSLFRGWKCYKTSETETSEKECRIVDYQGPLVSFLRIGTLESSKSEILNAVIGGESNIFFYRRQCEGGDCKRNFVDGLVEMGSYFPSGKETDIFDDPVIFLNLRGDAQQHSKQVEFLQKISCVSVVLISDTNTNIITVEMLKQFAKTPGGIILLCDEAADKETKSNARRLRQAVPNSSKIKLKDKNMVKSIATLKKEVQENIAKKICQVTTEKHMPISKCCQIAHDANIKIDEDNEASKAGKQYADMVMKKVNGQTKDKMLPLQSSSLWHKWAEHNKERHRHAEQKEGVTDYNAQKDDEKRKVRVKQLHHCTHLTPVMDNFLKHLLEKNITIRKYFLLWLKLFLDDQSRNVLPTLHAEYQKTRDRLYALKHENQSKNNSKIIQLTEKLKIQNQELIYASFGLEHFFREMGQIYEACNDFTGCRVSKTLQDKVKLFPKIMADIMEEGLCALEIMDGDASHVPSLWVLAVIDKLKVVCGKNARQENGGKAFVLSVLGIQSTGKSTLLNTLFGLRFNVSAGRCTRGAYIQLLPLNNSLKQQIDCDYVLVVDTEGLRAPELELEGLKHDNELATFVIGLADATIINIYGESPGDLEGILQTSSHAFIRMRNVKMHPGCLFVHQNVPDVLASSKSKMGRQKFHNILDNMTQAAARIEKCGEQYHSFRQVIDFDDKKHVFYFPSLWKGNPPMASVNTGYSESAQTLKKALIEISQDKRTCRCALETFKLRVQQIWQAVLQENFIFSFKNTLEVCAYSELDSQYAQWSWSLRSEILEWENTTKLKINNFDTESAKIKSKLEQKIRKLNTERDEQKSEIKRSIIEVEIKCTAENCLSTAKSVILKSHNETLEKMKSFLDSANYSDTLSQWRHETEKKIKELHDDNEKKVESYCEELVKNKLNHVEVDHQEVVNLVKINSHITELVDKSWKEAKYYSDRELEKMFEDTWKQWMVDFETKTAKTVEYPSSAKIDGEIVKILRELMRPEDPLIVTKLTEKSFGERTKSCSLELKVNKETHLISSRKSWYSGFIGNENNDIKSADKFTNECLSKAREYLDSIKRDLKLFNPSFVHKLLRDLFTSLKDLMESEKKNKFKFTAEYKVDMALVVCAYASAVFKQTTEKIKKDNNPVAKLNKMKNDFMIKFKNKYREVNDEKQAAIDLCALLRDSIKEAVEASLENKIVDKLRLKSHLESKKNFNIQILEDLMMKGDSSLYRTYIYNIPECYRYWIKHYIDDYVSQSPTVVTNLAQKQLSKITKKVTDTIGFICMQVDITKLETWLSIFTENLQGTLPLPRNKVNAYVGSCEVKLFSKYINEEFDQIKLSLETKFNNARSIIDAMSNRRNSPENLLYDKLIGCSATCPFCKEKCDMDVNHLGDHSMTLHRPECLGGYRNKYDKKLWFITCTEAINSRNTFECRETDYKQVKCSDYKTYFPNWHIPKLACGDPKYWKWFVCQYKQDVIEWADASDTDIPSHWFHITQKDAKDSLKSIYVQ